MALVALLAAPVKAAIARTYPDALSKAGKNPIVIFIYGANYDKVSQRTYETFIKKNKIAPYIRQTVFLEMPLYQLPNDKEKKDMEKRLGGKRLPGGIVLPRPRATAAPLCLSRLLISTSPSPAAPLRRTTARVARKA